MAVSFRQFVFLTALGVFGFGYVIMNGEFVPVVEPLAAEHSTSAPATSYLGWQREMWRLLPLVFVFAAVAWLTRESVQVRRP